VEVKEVSTAMGSSAPCVLGTRFAKEVQVFNYGKIFEGV